MSSLFIECVVAPAYDQTALQILTRKKNVRVLVYGGIDEPVAGEPEGGSWGRRHGRSAPLGSLPCGAWSAAGREGRSERVWRNARAEPTDGALLRTGQ